MTQTAPETRSSAEVAAAPEPHRHVRAFVIVLGAALLHAWAVWGYTGIFWGSHGRWLHAVSRFAGGEVPYRDFAYANPPFALWLVGSIAKLAGTSYAAISAIMSTLFVGTFTLLLFALRRLIPDLVLAVALPSVLFSAAYAFRHGTSLPAGTDSPAAPIGFLCVLGATWLIFETVERPRVGFASSAGLLLGLAVLSRHDYWLASFYLLLAGSIPLARRGAAPVVRWILPATFAAVILVAVLIVAATAGWDPATHVFVNWDRVLDLALQGMPSMERVVSEVAGAAILVLTAIISLWLCLAISDGDAARWGGVMLFIFLTATAIHLGMSVGIGYDLTPTGMPSLPTLAQEAMWTELRRGRGLFSAALVLFDARLQAHLFPVILPPLLLAVLFVRWPKWHDPVLRGRLALLLGLCVAARMRRGFAGADWDNVLLEIPAYALYLKLICGPNQQKAARAVRAALAVLIVVGAWAYISLAAGPLTVQGSYPPTLTRNGVVRWPAPISSAYRTAERLVTGADSTGRRPAYAFGASGGWNYFLARPNPLPFGDGLPSNRASTLDSGTALLRAARPLLIDNRLALRHVLAPSRINAWEPNAIPNRFEMRDRPWFLSQALACPRVADPDSSAVIFVYDCGR